MEKLKRMNKLFFNANSVVWNVLQKPLRFSIYVNEIVARPFQTKSNNFFKAVFQTQ